MAVQVFTSLRLFRPLLTSGANLPFRQPAQSRALIRTAGGRRLSCPFWQSTRKMNGHASLDGESYSRYHRLVKEIVDDATRQFFPAEWLPGNGGGGGSSGRCLLDLGCGTGENIRRFGRLVGASRIVGVDLNQNFLDFAANQHREAPDSGVELELLRLDLNQPDWSQQVSHHSYDIVTSFLTLQWVRDLSSCLLGLRATMSSRTLAYHVIGIKPGINFQLTLRELGASPRWGPTVRSYMHATRWQDPCVADWRAAPDPAGAFRDFLTGAGFCVSVCSRMAFTYTTEDEAECRGHLRWLVPFATELPPEERGPFLDEFMSVYSKHTPQVSPGRFVWHNEVLVVLATVSKTPASASSN